MQNENLTGTHCPFAAVTNWSDPDVLEAGLGKPVEQQSTKTNRSALVFFTGLIFGCVVLVANVISKVRS